MLGQTREIRARLMEHQDHLTKVNGGQRPEARLVYYS